ncbi:hypothetical protein LMH87_001626 [Akanthomyces muscarius]|uniref:Uncharacterized protein n=1 Tax=Akanthomyces muscarius TaxID=2231603 RepID=A0A9W8Q6V3_AKAMU|nr:hypothetical protein LMH87_001626 [Akanthomyces muscarius]KAJ4147078.1 hypothetical protein LMH87_001626 [Akanthomyces muscarius]
MIPGGRLTHHSSLHSSFVFFFSFVTLFEPFQRLLVYVLGFCLDFLDEIGWGLKIVAKDACLFFVCYVFLHRMRYNSAHMAAQIWSRQARGTTRLA